MWFHFFLHNTLTAIHVLVAVLPSVLPAPSQHLCPVYIHFSDLCTFSTQNHTLSPLCYPSLWAWRPVTRGSLCPYTVWCSLAAGGRGSSKEFPRAQRSNPSPRARPPHTSVSSPTSHAGNSHSPLRQFLLHATLVLSMRPCWHENDVWVDPRRMNKCVCYIMLVLAKMRLRVHGASYGNTEVTSQSKNGSQEM